MVIWWTVRWRAMIARPETEVLSTQGLFPSDPRAPLQAISGSWNEASLHLGGDDPPGHAWYGYGRTSDPVNADTVRSRIFSLSEQEESDPVYAIVRAGGRQEKVSVDDVLNIDKVSEETGATITWQPILVVDDGNVVSDADKLSGYTVTAEVLGETKGPKINIMKYKNKTGYKKRQGHRQKHTQVRVTGIAAK
jgi:large subunit ribosomal protein L21